MAYQVAQKLHACTDPDDPPEFTNDRVRDIVDLLLIKDSFYADGVPVDLRAACVDVFDARATDAAALGHPPRLWPPQLAVPNSSWTASYPKLSKAVGITLTTHARRQQPSITVRQVPRTNRELPRWEVLSGAEATGWQVIGWIQEEHLRGARNPFFFAIGIHPVDHRHYRLEGNIDFDERVNTIADFRLDPNTSRQHSGLETRQ